MSALMQQMRAASPSFLYDMNEGGGPNIWDYSGNGFNATEGGVPNYRNTNVAPGFSGMRLNGTNAWVSVPSAALNSSAGQVLTVIMWVKMLAAAPAGANMMFSRGTAANAIATGWYVATAGDFTYHTHNGVNDEYGIPTDTPGVTTGPVKPFTVAAGTVMAGYQITAAGNVRIHVNGRFYPDYTQRGPGYVSNFGSAAAGAPVYNFSNAGNLRIGYAGYYGGVDAAYGPVAGYQSALTDDQVMAIYKAGIRGGVMVG